MFENWQKLVSSNKIDLVHEKITYYNKIYTPETEPISPPHSHLDSDEDRELPQPSEELLG